MRVYMECSGCGIHEWEGEVWQLTVEGDDDEPSEMTFHSRECLMEWLTADKAAEEADAENDPIGYCPSCAEDRTFAQCSPLEDTPEYVCDTCGYVIETRAS